MKQLTKDDVAGLLETSSIKSKLKKELRIVPDEIHDWADRDFVVFMNKSKSVGIMIADLDGATIVPIALQKRKPLAGSGRTEPIICDICSTWRRGSESATITFTRGDKSSVTFLCCADLLCSLHVRQKTDAATLSKTQLRENISPGGRVERLHVKLKRILRDLSV